MRLVHYAEQAELAPVSRTQDGPGATFWRMLGKPYGLWVGVEDNDFGDEGKTGEDGWLQWTLENHFHPEKQTYAHPIKLKPDANILRINNHIELYALTGPGAATRPQYSKPSGSDLLDARVAPDWESMAEKYQGIIISPYQWVCRLEEKSIWYYGWDCASGCIWDADCIEKVESSKVEP